MLSALSVALGGAIGSVLRYLIGLIKINESTVFPFKTLAINIVGSFLIGLITTLAAGKATLSPNTVLLLKVGICGGFTTFSTFALESVTLFRGGRAGAALLYIFLSITASLAAVLLAQVAAGGQVGV